MKILSFTRKTLLEYLREPLLWGLVLAFPPLMVAVMYMAFGQPQQSMARTLRVLVINQDRGTIGETLIEIMHGLTFEGQPVFNLEELVDPRLANTLLQENRAALLITIPPDFSAAIQPGAEAAAPSEITLTGNPAAFNFIFARGFAEDVLRTYINEITSRPLAITTSYEFVPGTGKASDFDISTPGIVVFGVLFLSISTATTLVREHVAHTLQRLRLTRVHAGHMLLGVASAQMLIAIIQVLLAFGVAIAYGFGQSGNITPDSLALAVDICLLFSLSVIGIGLMVAAFARNDGEASNLAMLPLVPMAFLSGAIYPMPAVPLLTVAGQTVGIYDIMSSTHAANAMLQILIYGKGPGEIGYSLFMLALLALVYLTIGIGLYQRFRLR